MKTLKVPNSTIRRLPCYLQKLDELSARGVTKISSNELGREMGYTPSQIRQDFSSLGTFGITGYGYDVPTLRKEIASIVGRDSGFKAILVGVGKMGRTLLAHFDFEKCGVSMECAFDIRNDMTGTMQSGVPVLHMRDLPQYLINHPIDIVVLAVPPEVAVQTERMLVNCGVTAIWNFTDEDLKENRSTVLVENVNFAQGLYALSHKVARRKQREQAMQMAN